MATKSVVVVGVGTVGSQVARELANTGVGHLRLVDHDVLESHNLPRHALTSRYVGMNKAVAMAGHLSESIVSLRTDARPFRVDDTLSDQDVDRLVDGADLIVAATDERQAQRRLGRRALSLDIPAVFPALDQDGGGEVFVQPGPGAPCFFCWDGFRNNREQLRAVSAINADALPVIELAVRLSLEVLDPSTLRFLATPRGDLRTRQLFVQRPFAALSMAPVRRRPDCPSCRVGPARPTLDGVFVPSVPVNSSRGAAQREDRSWHAVRQELLQRLAALPELPVPTTSAPDGRDPSEYFGMLVLAAVSGLVLTWVISGIIVLIDAITSANLDSGGAGPLVGIYVASTLIVFVGCATADARDTRRRQTAYDQRLMGRAEVLEALDDHDGRQRAERQ